MALQINESAIVWSGSLQERKPLVVIMHGLGSHEHDLASLVQYLPTDFTYASLRAPLEAMGGYAWFPPSQEPGRPRNLDMDDATAAVLSWIDSVVPADIPVIPMGFSQGGAMVSHLLRTWPQRFVAGVMMSGFISEVALETDALFTEHQIPVFIGRGDADPVIPQERFELASDWMHEHSILTEVVYNGMAHAVCGPEIENISQFLTYAIGSENDRYAEFLRVSE